MEFYLLRGFIPHRARRAHISTTFMPTHELSSEIPSFSSLPSPPYGYTLGSASIQSKQPIVSLGQPYLDIQPLSCTGEEGMATVLTSTPCTPSPPSTLTLSIPPSHYSLTLSTLFNVGNCREEIMATGMINRQHWRVGKEERMKIVDNGKEGWEIRIGNDGVIEFRDCRGKGVNIGKLGFKVKGDCSFRLGSDRNEILSLLLASAMLRKTYQPTPPEVVAARKQREKEHKQKKRENKTTPNSSKDPPPKTQKRKQQPKKLTLSDESTGLTYLPSNHLYANLSSLTKHLFNSLSPQNSNPTSFHHFSLHYQLIRRYYIEFISLYDVNITEGRLKKLIERIVNGGDEREIFDELGRDCKERLRIMEMRKQEGRASL